MITARQQKKNLRNHTPTMLSTPVNKKDRRFLIPVYSNRRCPVIPAAHGKIISG
jgi:hypothetical protein